MFSLRSLRQFVQRFSVLLVDLLKVTHLKKKKKNRFHRVEKTRIQPGELCVSMLKKYIYFIIVLLTLWVRVFCYACA